MKRFLSMLLCMSMIFTLFVFVPATASAEVTYSAPTRIWYQNFSNDTSGATVSTNSTITQATDDSTGNKYLSFTNAGSGSVTVSATSNVDASYYVVEYKIKSDLMTNKNRAVYSRDGGGTYKAPHVSIYKGNLFKNNTYANDTNPLTTDAPVKNNTWHTVTVIYDGEYVDSTGAAYTSGDRYIYRDIYLDGELKAENLLASVKNKLPFIENASGALELKFHTNGAINLQLDDFKFYAAATTFAAKLPEDSDTALDNIDVWFNNIPVKADLLSEGNIEVVNASGTKVAAVESVSIHNDFDPGTDYAQSVNLAFDTVLAPETSYKLKFNDVKDFAGNALNTELTFTTGESFEYGSFEFAGDNKTVSIDITKNISAEKVYKLIIAGYEEYNGGFKMVSAAEKDITITSGTNTYTSNALDIPGDYVKAFLWDDMKPVVTQGEKSITQ